MSSVMVMESWDSDTASNNQTLIARAKGAQGTKGAKGRLAACCAPAEGRPGHHSRSAGAPGKAYAF